TLLRDGQTWHSGVAPARRWVVPAAARLQLAAAPGGTLTAELFGVDCAGHLAAFDRASGPTGLPLLDGTGLCSAVAFGMGRASLYANDADDRDGDGLGRALERELGTCDGAGEPGCGAGLLAAYYARPGATRDSDRDGLSDAAEVLGAGRLLDLPRYGANPLHKDVFVEVDYDARADELGMREADFAQVASAFAAGSARELQNPDRKPGVSLHFDVGFAPVDSTHLGLLGDWGGSGRASSDNYRAARERDFSPERAGYFRYAFLTRGGRGQARRDAITVNRDLARVSIFTHELGHTLGIEHHGADDWGQSNCKPNYFSIMNYVYQNRPGMGFSRTAGTVLDPGAAWETMLPDDGVAADALRAAPLELDVADGGIDWNRDGIISQRPVRAALTWATYKSCGSAGHARTTLRDAGLRAATPALFRLGSQLYAAWLSAGGELYVRHSPLSGPDAGGSCPEGDGAATRCTTWAAERAVGGLPRLAQIALLADGDAAAWLAYLREDGQLGLARLELRQGALELREDQALAGAFSNHAPALARAGAGVRVLYRARDGALFEAQAGRTSRVLDTQRRAIAVGLAPSLLALGTGELCGVFPDHEGYVRFYCEEQSGWRDLTSSAFYAALGPKTSGPVGLAYHRYRASDGGSITPDVTRGAVMLSFTEPESASAKYPDNPHYFVSEWLSAAHPAREALYFRWRGSVIDEWTTLEPGTGLALYEDEQLSALKALMLAKLPAALHLDFLPFADGVHAERLGSGNDFELMANGICEGLRGRGGC
ncbi:MAG TPA: hypothetical protein VJR89_11550, partial [Polyangiales bacterium]|nr:hypothetical protein [Polyangiales bacterium]